ncbi:MAG: hypothetical protein MO852_14355, partial [Candidatus Devosia euplotis]|nr:hypothetical protein [Candidatus Devosia euplotis]
TEGYGLNPVPPRLIAKSLGMNVSVVDETLQAYKSPVNEDIVLDGQSTGSDDCTDLANESELKQIIRAAIDTLPEERREICKMRMGIGMPRVMMLKEVAEKLNTTSEVVRKKEKDCLRLLRNGRYGRHLHELFAHA